MARNISDYYPDLGEAINQAGDTVIIRNIQGDVQNTAGDTVITVGDGTQSATFDGDVIVRTTASTNTFATTADATNSMTLVVADPSMQLFLGRMISVDIGGSTVTGTVTTQGNPATITLNSAASWSSGDMLMITQIADTRTILDVNEDTGRATLMGDISGTLTGSLIGDVATAAGDTIVNVNTATFNGGARQIDIRDDNTDTMATGFQRYTVVTLNEADYELLVTNSSVDANTLYLVVENA